MSGSKHDHTPPPRHLSPTPALPCAPFQRYLSPTPPAPSEEEIEQEVYHRLVSDGGCPLFPVERYDEIRTAPELHRDLLQPWSDAIESRQLPQCQHIFRNQYDSWQNFRLWQKIHRSPLADDDDDDDDDDPTSPDTTPSQGKSKRSPTRAFADYVEEMRARLARYWFRWQGYTLCEDLEEQDTQGTWIEYLNYGYVLFENAKDQAVKLQKHAPLRRSTYAYADEAQRTALRRARLTANQCERRAFWIREQVPILADQLSIDMRRGKRVRFDEHVTVIDDCVKSLSEHELLAGPDAHGSSASVKTELSVISRKRRAVTQGDEMRTAKRRKLC